MIQTILTPDSIDTLPQKPSVYAISSINPVSMEVECRYVGYTINLQESIRQHFDPWEPDVNLRYMMISEVTKLLHYEIELNGISSETTKKVIEWKERFCPLQENDQ
jgi:hypothetical protein